MVFNIVSSPRENLTPQQILDLANIYLENASKAQDPGIAIELCHDTEVALSQAKKSFKRSKDTNQDVLHGIATAYMELAIELDKRGCSSEAQESFKKAKKGGVVAPSSEASNAAVPSEKKRKQGNLIAAIPQNIFAENITPPSIVTKFPDIDGRLLNTTQLACCLGLLKAFKPLDNALEPIAHNWIQAVEKEEDEKERLKMLSLDVIRAYRRDEIKDAKMVAEVVSLAPVLEKVVFRDLLNEFYDGVDRSGLLDFHQLDGLAQLIQGADTGYLDADDLVKILGLLSTRLRNTHQQSQKHMYELTLTASHVLDAMADTRVSGLDREKLHEPLSSYLNLLKKSSDPCLVYQAAYAYQALLYVPDDETLWQAAFRCGDKVIRGLADLVKAVKGLDLNGFIDGLKDIHQGLAAVSDAALAVKRTYDGVTSLIGGGKGFISGLREGFSFKHKCAWYPALRGADALIQNGEFASFKTLVCEAPCRLDPAFQWGVCQRLGEIAANPMWDTRTRQSAGAFLGEIFRNDEYWGQDVGIKEWILVILMHLASPPEGALQSAEALLQELEANTNPQQQILIQTCRKKRTSYPLKVVPPPLASPSLLDRAQSKPDVEGTLRQLRRRRLKEQGTAVYIQPQAKATLQASYDQRFPLIKKVDEFLDSTQRVFLLLGDSGAGKSTFNRQLECELWNKYKKNTGRIPLHINLPAIDKPEQDMISKQLRKAEFTEPEIRELKVHRSLILICDGYDESQQTHNLYVSNRLNQPGEWNVQMVVSCRSEYLGVDYRDRFQPVDRNSQPGPGLFQEAVITPFTPDQIQNYIKQYVSVHQPLWEAKDYEQALDVIPGLKELVRNPFLMALSLEVLPRMVDPGEHLSVTHITRVALYDQFIEHWLERGKKRLSEKDLSPQAKAAFESLTDEGFTQNGIDFLKRLSAAIYKEQDGHPIVKYSRFKDGGSWKAEFFSREDEKQLLREACPLARNGNQYRFIHRSLLEYGITLAVFDPNDWKEKIMPVTLSERRGSTSSDYSFRDRGSAQEVTAPVKQGPDIRSPISWRYFVDDPSVLQFLCERAQQEPVFKQQLLDYIEHSKTDKKWRKAAANAITILVRAGVQFINNEDLRGIQIPGADLSFGVFESAQLQDADLRQVSFRGAWLRRADLSKAHMRGAQFGELPFLKENDRVKSCAFSPDGKLLALGLTNGVINLYSTSNWEQVQMLVGHEKDVNCIAFSSRGDQIISGSHDGTVRLWATEAGTCIRILSGQCGADGVAFSPLGDTVASAHGSSVRVWDVETGECRLRIGTEALTIEPISTFLFGCPSERFKSIAYSPKGDQIVSGERSAYTQTCAVQLWDVETGNCLHSLSGHSNTISEVVYTPRGDRIASGSEDATVRIWDVKTKTCCRVLTDHAGPVLSVAFSPQGDMIASAGQDKTVRIWNAETGACHHIFTGHSDIVTRVVFSPKGDYIASGSYDQTLRLWDIGSEETRQIAIGHSKEILSVACSPDGDEVVSCSDDGSIRLRDALSGVCRRTITSDLQKFVNIRYSQGGALFVSGFKDMRDEISHIEGTVVAYSLQRNQVASGDSGGGSMRMEDVKTKECSKYFIGSVQSANCIMNSPRGIYIVSSFFHIVVIRDIESGMCLHQLDGHSAKVMSVAYSPRNDLLVSAGSDTTVRLWDTGTGECHRILIGHVDCVWVVFSPHGDQVASGYEDGLVKIWDVGTGECLLSLTGHTKKVTSVIFSSKGDRIVSGSEDKTIRLWDITSGQCQAVVQELNSHVLQIAWSTTPDVNCFVVGCEDGSEWMGQVIEHGDLCHIRWRWRTVNGGLNLEETVMQDIRGLSHLNKQLLEQRGAEGEPSVRLREVAKNVSCMVSVVSNLKQPSTEMALETSSISNPAAGQSE